MTLTEITNIANNYTDENFSTTVTISYMNSAISKINTSLKTELPLVSSANSDYAGLSDSWLNTVVVPYICWSIKMNDSSINEAQQYLFDFQRGLNELKKNRKLAIPEEYQGAMLNTVYPIKRYTGL